jgi:hypothetical protein
MEFSGGRELRWQKEGSLAGGRTASARRGVGETAARAGGRRREGDRLLAPWFRGLNLATNPAYTGRDGCQWIKSERIN